MSFSSHYTKLTVGLVFLAVVSPPLAVVMGQQFCFEENDPTYCGDGSDHCETSSECHHFGTELLPDWRCRYRDGVVVDIPPGENGQPAVLVGPHMAWPNEIFTASPVNPPYGWTAREMGDRQSCYTIYACICDAPSGPVLCYSGDSHESDEHRFQEWTDGDPCFEDDDDDH